MIRESALKLAISTVLPADLRVVSVRGREMLSQLSRVEVYVVDAVATLDVDRVGS